MFKNEIVRLWANRAVAFFFGGLLLYIIMQSAVVNGLENQIEKVTIELNDIQYEPGRLLEESRMLFEDKDYENAIISLDNLIKNHPTSDEAVQGKVLYTEVETEKTKMDRLWDEEGTLIREEWEKTTALQMENELEEQYVQDKTQMQTNMESTLEVEWDKVKGDIRKEWEKHK